MNEFLIYLVKANAALALFYLGYRFFLQNLTFYKLNRYYFLLTFLFAALYPAVDWIALFKQQGEIPATMTNLALEWQVAATTVQSLTIADIMEYLFWISAAVFGIRLLVQLSGLWRIHLKSSPSYWKMYAYRKSADDIVPFSFWKNIYMNPDRHQESEYDQILKHEYVHVQQLHSMDILLTELAILFFWYNPFCWLLRNAVRENIEFITDRRVLDSGIDRKNYQYSLLNISTLSYQPVLGNHFNLRNLKKRIMMMNKKQSPTVQLSKYAFILPVVLAGSMIFGLLHAGQKEPLPSKADGEQIDIVVSKANPEQNKAVASEIASEQGNVILAKVESKQDTIKKNKVKKNIVITGWKSDTSKQKPLYVLNGKVLTGNLDQIEPNDIEEMEVLKGESAEALYGEKGKHGVVFVTTKQVSKEAAEKTVRIELNDNKSATRTNLNGKKPLIIVDGVKVDEASLADMDPKTIKAIEVLKDEHSLKVYGEEAKDGVIRVTTHQWTSKKLP